MGVYYFSHDHLYNHYFIITLYMISRVIFNTIDSSGRIHASCNFIWNTCVFNTIDNSERVHMRVATLLGTSLSSI